MAQHHSLPKRRHSCGDSKVMVRRFHRHRCLLPALAFFTLHEESLSLILPQQQCLSRQQTFAQPHEFQYCHIRRKRSLFELQLQFPSDQESSHAINSNISPLFSYRVTNNGVSGRLPTSLFMNQNSDSGGGFGKGGDDKKKKRDNSDPNSSPKSKSNKSVAKGTSAPGNNTPSDRPNNKAKRPKRRSNNKMNNKKKRKNKSKSTGERSKGKAKAASNSGASMLTTDKSSIKTNDENNSLKGFKSERQPASPQRFEQQTRGSSKEGKDENNSSGDLEKRVVQLEMIVSNQMTEIQKLRREVEKLTKATSVFSNVVDVLREAGLRIDGGEEIVVGDDEVENEGDVVSGKGSASAKRPLEQQAINDDMEIFGIAPKSVTDAADAAGASILSAILAGKHRMLVDVRDAELTRDPKLFVEFIELAVLPVAAGLEGLDDGDEYVRNRVKIVFPTVKELMSYRRSMALAAPDVVSLSTLGFDPVDERDNLIVLISPSPDDMAGVSAMEKLLARTDQNYVEPDLRITQPVVVLNHHMVPIDMARFGKFTSVYHLRLLSVQYMTGDALPEYVAKEGGGDSINDTNTRADSDTSEGVKQNSTSTGVVAKEGNGTSKAASDRSDEEDAALEAAMIHAREIGVHQGVTRAMVIRAYPKPWHVFVDTSPDTDADFDVAATFDVEPTQEDVNYAIVECLEGSEREDEIVAQQMQAALESGQLNRVSDMLGISPSDIVPEDKAAPPEEDGGSDVDNPGGEYDGNDWDDLYYDDWLSEDSV